MSEKLVVGYTSGVYGLFHIGHLNLLKNAKGLCDKLIVGVTVDKLVEYKNKRSVIPFEERIEIVRNIKCVDAAIPQEDLDKYKMWENCILICFSSEMIGITLRVGRSMKTSFQQLVLELSIFRIQRALARL